MQEEKLLLTRQDRDRLKVLHEVRQGHITQREAAQQLKLTDRWIRELVGRVEEQGDQAIIHGLRGRPGKRKISAQKEKRAVEIIGREYEDFGPTLVGEYLARNHGIVVSRETVRQWMMRGGIWKKRRQRIQQVHLWRRRRSCFGELVQWDTSDHDWLEGRGERIYLIGMLDDATSRGLARFAPHDSTAENMRLLWAWLEKYGRFVDAYTDRAGLFETNRPNQRQEEDGQLAKTQIGRALGELGIGWIGARSAQAKGRIERFFETAQDRLVKGMRKQKVCTLQAANEYLEQEYLPLWNERFTVPPASAVDAHRALEQSYDLASILSYVEQRVVGPGYTIRYDGKLYQVERAQIRPGLRGQKVRVEQHLDGNLAVRGPHGPLGVKLCEGAERAVAPEQQEAPPAKPVAKASRPGRRRWMEGFDLDRGPSLRQAIASAYGEVREESERRW